MKNLVLLLLTICIIAFSFKKSVSQDRKRPITLHYNNLMINSQDKTNTYTVSVSLHLWKKNESDIMLCDETGSLSFMYFAPLAFLQESTQNQPLFGFVALDVEKNEMYSFVIRQISLIITFPDKSRYVFY